MEKYSPIGSRGWTLGDSEASEWRTFANESGDNNLVLVGGPTNPLLADGVLSTVIAKPNDATGRVE